MLAWPYHDEGAIWSEGLDELADRYFAGGWQTRNARIRRAIPLRHTKPILTANDLFSADELDRLPFNAEFINPAGFRWTAGCFIGSGQHAHTAFALERKVTSGDFETNEIEALTACLPHLQQAAAVAARIMALRCEGMLDAFESMNCPAILLDLAGHVQSINERAQRHIGHEIQIVQGQLITCHKEANSALQQLIGALLQPSITKSQTGRAIAAIPRREGRPLFAYGIPLLRSAQDIFQYARAVLILVDPDEHLNPPALILRQGFKLTPAETRLALAIAHGSSLANYADSQKISVGTARIQLKAVMAKTGTHRQAELVSLLAQLAQALPVKED